MAMTPVTPQFSIKSFWARPEGKVGAVVLVATAIAGIYGFLLILPWLAALALTGAELVAAGIATAAMLYIVTNKTFRNRMKNIFQLGMRWFTGMIIEIDPIGILQNSVDQMIENKGKLDSAVAQCSGARQQVQGQMDANNKEIRHATSLKEEADRQLTRASDALTQQRLNLNRTMQLQEIGRRMHSNEKLQVILNQTTKLYDLLGRWQNLADFNIENTKAEVKNAKAERTAILAAYRGMGFAQRIIKGDPEQLQMLNQSLEYLAEDNANKLGAMEDFARVSQSFLGNMDLETGAAAGDAEKMLAQYEQKLLTAGGQQAPAMPGDTRQPVAVPRQTGYLD
jgi:hypothetical protein